jgi:outer membrane receptor protein involved in Fe transport
MRQHSAAANLSGEAFELWAGPVGVGVGVEWRELEGEVQSDSVSNTVPGYTGVRGLPAAYVGRVGGWSTSNVLPTNGEYDVKEGFVEVLVPLAKELAFARALDLNAAARVTDYSQSGTVETWKLGLTWRPVDDLLVRATRSRDIRAPGIGDLFSRDSQGPNTIVIDRGNNNSSVSVPIILSGNPTLQPEEADTKTFGVTYQASWLPGLAMSADYYDISIADVLATVSAQETIDRCSVGQQIYCDNLLRNGATLTAIRQRTMNLSEARTKGVDLDLSYRRQLLGANSTFRLIGTRLLEQSTTVPSATGATYTDRVGDANLGYAKWIISSLNNFEIGQLGFNVNARFISGGRFNTTYLPGDIDPNFEDVGSNLTVDVGARYRLEGVGRESEIYVNVANVFDKDPPLLPSSALVGAQTNVTLYDTLGRYYTAGVRVRF